MMRDGANYRARPFQAGGLGGEVLSQVGYVIIGLEAARAGGFCEKTSPALDKKHRGSIL